MVLIGFRCNSAKQKKNEGLATMHKVLVSEANTMFSLLEQLITAACVSVTMLLVL